MNSDKRRRSRVQGGWAATTQPDQKSQRKVSSRNQAEIPVWLVKDADGNLPTKSGQYLFDETAKVILRHVNYCNQLKHFPLISERL